MQHHIQLEKQVNVYPIEKQSTFTGNFLEEQFYSTRSNEIISDNATNEIACLRDQVNTLISRSGEKHKIPNNSNANLSGFEDLHLTNNRVSSSVRRASSFHGKDFVDNSSYFDKKVDDLRKSNSHQNIFLNNDCLQRDNAITEVSNEISWKDADGYFKSVVRKNTPAPQTGRASVAKLRAQNAGMVLAKAKLFDECTTKTSDFTSANASSKKHCRDNANAKRSPNVAKETDASVEHFKQSYKRTQVSRKQSSKEAKGKNYHPVVQSPNVSSQIKTQITATQTAKSHQEHADKNYRPVQRFEMQNQKLSNKDPISYPISAKDKTINIARDMEIHQKENTAMNVSPLMKMSIDTVSQNSNLYSYKTDVSKTPHIKRPLTVKTPKSTKLMRKPPVETRRTPLRATAQLGTPKRQSPKSILKTKTLSMHT